MAAPPDMPDVNVWLALSASEHPFHAVARDYWHLSAGRQLLFCRVTALGFLRLVTNSVVMGGLPLDPREAVSAYRVLREIDDIGMAREPVGVEQVLERWVGRDLVSPKLWTDAYLAAFAKAAGLRIVTFDRDYHRFEGLDVLLLEAVR